MLRQVFDKISAHNDIPVISGTASNHKESLDDKF